MGRETTCQCRVGATSASVKALLESSEVILRGAIKRRLPFSGLTNIRVVRGALQFDAAGEGYVLELGAEEAAKWQAKLTTPPPSLAAKLGLLPDRQAFVVGSVNDSAVAEALRDHTTEELQRAQLIVAMVAAPADVERVVAMHQKSPQCALWLVYAKGPAAVFGEAPVRSAMRAAGYMDNKVSAVSPQFSATRFAPTK